MPSLLPLDCQLSIIAADAGINIRTISGTSVKVTDVVEFHQALWRNSVVAHYPQGQHKDDFVVNFGVFWITDRSH